MERELDLVRDEIKEMRRSLARNGEFGGSAHSDFLARAEAELSRRQAESEAVNQEVILPGNSDEQLVGPIEVGDRVWVPSLQASGEVLALHPRSEEADVQLGNFRLKLPVKRMELRQKAQREEPDSAVAVPAARPSPGLELDLRGVRVEEGLERVERYLDDAYMARLPWVQIIHGKGTGALRDAVRTAVKDHPLVSSARAGGPGEGGDGVTVVKLVDNE